MTIGYQSPVSGPGGDSDGDDAAAASLWGAEGSPGIWTPECWHKSADQLRQEAAAMNRAAFAGVAAAATKHSNPPAFDSVRDA